MAAKDYKIMFCQGEAWIAKPSSTNPHLCSNDRVKIKESELCAILDFVANKVINTNNTGFIEVSSVARPGYHVILQYVSDSFLESLKKGGKHVE